MEFIFEIIESTAELFFTEVIGSNKIPKPIRLLAAAVPVGFLIVIGVLLIRIGRFFPVISGIGLIIFSIAIGAVLANKIIFGSSCNRRQR